MRTATIIEFLSSSSLERLAAERVGKDASSYGEEHERVRRVFADERGSTAAALREAGWTTTELFVNDEVCQRAWARESGVVPHGLAVAIEQVRRLAPDVLFVGDVHAVPRVFLAAIRGDVGLMAGRLDDGSGQPFPVGSYDLVLTRREAAAARVVELGGNVSWDPMALAPIAAPGEVHLPSAAFGDRTRSIALARHDDCGEDLQSSVSALLAQSVSLDEVTTGAPDGLLARLEAMANTRIVVVSHGPSYGSRTGHPALLEATAAGALVLVDDRVDLDEVFSIGDEVVAYRSAEECVALVRHYLAHPERAAAIASAGRARCLRDRGSANYGAALGALFENALETSGRSGRASRPRAIDPARTGRSATLGAERA